MLCSPGYNYLLLRFRALQPKPRCLLCASSYPAVTEKQVIFHLPSSKTHTEQLPSNSQRAANLKLFHSHPLSSRRFAGCVSEIWTSLDPEDATSQYKVSKKSSSPSLLGTPEQKGSWNERLEIKFLRVLIPSIFASVCVSSWHHDH